MRGSTEILVRLVGFVGWAVCMLAPLAHSRAQVSDMAPALCLVGSEDKTSSLATALLVEGRKRGGDMRLTRAPERGGCPDIHRLTVTDIGVSVATPAGHAAPLTIEGETPEELAYEILQQLMPRRALGERVRLVDLDTPVRLPPGLWPDPTVGPTPQPKRIGVHLAAGGGYAYDTGGGLHQWSVSGEAALLVLREQLGVAVSGAYLEGSKTRRGEVATTSADLRRGELLLLVRGGLWLGPLLVRLGVGGGYEWRHATIAWPLRFDPFEIRTGGGLGALEGELMLPLGPTFAVRLLVPARIYFGETSYSLAGDSVLPASRGSVGVLLQGMVRL